MSSPVPTITPTPDHSRRGSAWEVFLAFLQLGLTSFGGPIAHLAYFRAEFVQRRHWLDDQSYSDLVALCQFLPGPASSQVGIALGWGRAGWRGAAAAWSGFTLPSALVLIVFALGIQQWSGLAQSGAIHGLKVVAVAVVAQAVWGMAKSLCPDAPRAAMALGAALVVLVFSATWVQFAVILMGACVGHVFLKHSTIAPTSTHNDFGVSKKTGAFLLGTFATLLAGLPWLASAMHSPALSSFSQFYQAGALVFGGGHVVLPLLQSAVVPNGLLSNDTFLAGYGAAQAVPGPLFTFAAYLGAAMPEPLGGWTGGVLLLVAGALPFWQTLRQQTHAQRTMAGINASVVGILLAALYDSVWTSAIHTRTDFALALAAFGLLVIAKASPVWVVMGAATAGVVLGW